MIECSNSTPPGLHPSAPSAAASSSANDSYFALPSSFNLSSGSPTATPAIDPTPYFTAPRSPLLLNQEFYDAIQFRFNKPTTPVATDNDSEQNLQYVQQPPTLPIGAASASSRLVNTTQVSQVPLSSASPRPPPNSATAPDVTDRIVVFSSERINQLLQQSSSLLLIDIRPFIHYSHLHIQCAINVWVSANILKRPSFTIHKISEVISQDQRPLWDAWQTYDNIILYDQNSNTLPVNSALTSLLAKFTEANYRGVLGYLQGGFDGFHGTYPDHCNGTPASASSQLPSQPNPFPPAALPITPNLPSTTRRRPGLHLGTLPGASSGAPGPFTAPTMALSNQAFNPFFSNIRQNMELSHGGIKERFPIRLPPHWTLDAQSGQAICSSPSEAHPLRDVIGVHLATSVVPSWLREMTASEDGPRRLAEMYEMIERTEQRRLQSLMAHHSRATSNLSKHPLSIVAGLEMGTLNRYTNVWPFEYTRVKINQREPGATDYINASYIEYVDCDPATIASPSESLEDFVPNLRSLDEQRKQSPTGRQYRRYISTQGPLPATFGDFWTVVWQQKTCVIVMLTKEEEMNRIKCHRYWPRAVGDSAEYGPIKVTCVAETTHQGKDKEDLTFVRKLVLDHQGMQRTVHHIQYMGWMDFGVPDDPIGTLALIKLADGIQRQSEEADEVGPMIVHCSAGCGRAGAFCAIDTVIRRLRKEEGGTIKNVTAGELDGQVDIMYQTVAKFREQRVSMVQTLRQFVFCYEAILWWILGYS
ncbi:protein-tyrosine phosphatase-like protein [Dichotomocladium elegans]|nr:protein-tyrosine phosphatase-like protein [Dichotomocladium elegans]